MHISIKKEKGTKKLVSDLVFSHLKFHQIGSKVNLDKLDIK